MSESESHIKVENGSDRNFGLVIGSVFLLIGLYPLLSGNEVRAWSLLIGAALICIGLLKPEWLSAANKLWFKFGLLLGAIVGPIVMGLIYYLAVTPTGLLLRLFGKDILNHKIDRNAASYWISRKEPVGSMKNQF